MEHYKSLLLRYFKLNSHLIIQYIALPYSQYAGVADIVQTFMQKHQDQISAEFRIHFLTDTWTQSYGMFYDYLLADTLTIHNHISFN
jgi:hypothetical protein